MTSGEPQSGRTKVRVALNWLIVYASWTGASALAVVSAFAVRRTLITAYTALAFDKWALGLVDKWSLFGLSLVSLVGILYAQYYLVGGYPGGPNLGTFPRRLLRVLIVEVAVLGPALLLRLVL